MFEITADASFGGSYVQEGEMDDSMRYQVISVTATELKLQTLPTDKQKKRGEKEETMVFTRK